jgi:hypothetical protein
LRHAAALLTELVQASGARRIAFVGLSKNAGKTTALVETLAGLHERSAIAGATSAGRDGEDFDALTGEPKPRFRLWRGQLVASADSTFCPGAPATQLLRRMTLATRFGSIEVRRLRGDGSMEVIGPSTAGQVAEACAALEQEGAQVVLIDGAFGRRAFASARIADGIVLAAGLSAAASLQAAVSEACSAVELLRLPAPSPGRSARFVDGALTDSVLGQSPPEPGDVLVAEDFASIFLSPQSLRALNEQGVTLAVRRPARLLAVIANPTAPGGTALSASRFFEALAREIPGVPLFDLRANLTRG